MITEIAGGDRLQLQVEELDPVTGDPVNRSYSYSNVNPNVDSEHLYAVGQGIGDLCEQNLVSVYRHKIYEIVDMG